MVDKTINHDVRVVNGRTLYMPAYVDNQEGWGNLALPDLSVADSVQKYPLGTRYVDGDRAFRYAKFLGTMNPDLLARDTQPQTVAYIAIQAATLQYATRFTCTVGAADGIAGDGDIAADELAGGYCVIFDASSKAITRQIKSNTATDGGGTMTVDVTDPIPVALTTSDHVECMASQYRYLTASTSNAYGMHVGLPVLVYTSGQFGWVQTWGPCWIAPQAAVGSGSNNRLCVSRHDGSVDELDYNDAANNKGQIVGHVMSHAQAGGQGAPFIWLMIAP